MSHTINSAGRLTIYGETMDLRVFNNASPSPHLIEVIRGAGPREGEHMLWGVLRLSDDGAVHLQTFDDKSDALQALAQPHD